MAFGWAIMRRSPKQERARKMVEKLLDATAATIAERGLDDTTTNHIAERAGVSIGSVYQYFPDKEALFAALMEKVSEDVSKTFLERAAQMEYVKFDLKTVAKYAILFGINMIKNDPLSLEIVKNWNRLPIDKLIKPLEKFFLVMAQPHYFRHNQNCQEKDLERKLYVLINSTLFTVMRYLLDRDNNIVTDKQLAEILSDMIVV